MTALSLAPYGEDCSEGAMEIHVPTLVDIHIVAWVKEWGVMGVYLSIVLVCLF